MAKLTTPGLLARMSTALVLAAAPMIGLAQAARAETAPRVLASIPVGDLNLSDPSQVRLFKARVDAAGQAVCAERAQAERLDRWSQRACLRDIQDEVLSKATRQQARALRAAGG
ncbi:MAG: UrcA family protein [Caulobacter sp.]|nr:UrcA family protein [Caulobacter sp.]